MKRISLITFALALLLTAPALAGGGADRGSGPGAGPGAGPGSDRGPGSGPGPGPEAGPSPQPGPRARECSLESLLLDLPAEPLGGAEDDDLLFMREEEKLARDVYLSFYESWEMTVFRKVARSERRHMAAVKVLLDRYQLGDPAAGKAVGVFENDGLASLYESAVADGLPSRIDALAVAIYIEEMDIFDLLRALERSDNRDIALLYQNLMKGSRNHLRAYYAALVRRGGTYDDPAFLSTATFEEILATPSEKGLVDEYGEWICGGSKKGRID